MVKRNIQEYERVSGQLVNPSKSGFLVDRKTKDGVTTRVKCVTGFSRRNLPTNYLGCPLFQGRKKKSLFINMIKKVAARMKGDESSSGV